jgi:hypothetical protein
MSWSSRASALGVWCAIARTIMRQFRLIFSHYGQCIWLSINAVYPYSNRCVAVCVFTYWYKLQFSWSQWPRGLRRRSAAARMLRSWVQISPRAWMFVCCECCVLSGRGLCDELIARPEESYRLWCVVVWSRNLKNKEAMTRLGSQRHSKKKSVLYEQWEVILSHYGRCIWLSVNAVYP